MTSGTITVGEFVAHDFRTSTVFLKYGIDFCCQGNRSIKEVCENRIVTTAELVEELSAVMMAEDIHQIDFKQWPLDLLVDYIEKKHHRSMLASIPTIKEFLKKCCHLHDEAHPELQVIQKLFQECTQTINTHIAHEEKRLFPYLRNLELHKSECPKVMEMRADSCIENPIAQLAIEHQSVGNRFKRIAFLSNQYMPPASACNTYRITYAMLKDFEVELHAHFHLENNILFPKAVQMEKRRSELKKVATPELPKKIENPPYHVNGQINTIRQEMNWPS